MTIYRDLRSTTDLLPLNPSVKTKERAVLVLIYVPTAHRSNRRSRSESKIEMILPEKKYTVLYLFKVQVNIDQDRCDIC